MLRAYAAIANGGTLIRPIIVQGEVQDAPKKLTAISDASMKVVHEGMHLAAEEGTARSLARPGMTFAAKTGTAELGASKDFVNSWIVGYYPYDEPKYAFVLLMEYGSRHIMFGAPPIMSQFITWMQEHTPEYIVTTGNQ